MLFNNLSASVPAYLVLQINVPTLALRLNYDFFLIETKWNSSIFIIFLMYSNENILIGTYLGSLYGANSLPYILISVVFLVQIRVTSLGLFL